MRKMNKNTSIVLIAAVAGIMIAGTLAVTLPTAAFAKITEYKGGIGGAGGAGGLVGNNNRGVGGAGDLAVQRETVVTAEQALTTSEATAETAATLMAVRRKCQ